MADRAASQPRKIAGRAGELRRLRTAIGRAAAGEPSATFVHGEAGVGKTVLARAAVREARAAGAEVLWGPCMRFGAGEAPMLPWTLALERWREEGEQALRTDVLATPGADRLLPTLGGGSTGSEGGPDGGSDGGLSVDPVRLVQVAESLVSRIARRRPLLVVLDDVQWADAASRDTVTYLVAGFGGQRLAVVATYRDEGLGPGDPLHGWLADLRRMPGVGEIRLERLNRAGVHDQLATLLDRDPAPQLVDAVLSRSGGNAYLTELLVHGLEPEAEQLPPHLPAALGEALLAAWHRVSGTAREVVRVLAVAGRPTPVRQLAEVCATLGLAGHDVRAALLESENGGIVVRAGTDQVWLRHPLLAEVLYETYPPGDVAQVHRSWAGTLTRGTGTGVDQVRRLGDLARHHQHAGNRADALRASLSAAEAAGGARLWRQEALHLRRATALCAAGSTPPGLDVGALSERAGIASQRVGDDLEALVEVERALAAARSRGEPPVIGRLTMRHATLRWLLGRVEGQPLDDYRAAVRLTEAAPDSPEHAVALATLSRGLSWSGADAEGAWLAEQAVAAAGRSGSREALSHAYGARAFANLEAVADGAERTDRDTRVALRLARQCNDADRVADAALVRCNFLVAQGRFTEATELAADTEAAALESGAVAAAAWFSGTVAHGLADAGRLRDAARHIRVGLSLVGPGNTNAAVRLSALVLAVRQGRRPAADLHRRRAEEQIPTLERRPGLEAPPYLAEHLCAEGRQGSALDLLGRTMPAQVVDRRVLDRMLLWGARAAADLAEVGRLRRQPDQAEAARQRLAELVAIRSGLPGEAFAVAGPGDLVQSAIRALFEAEQTRLGRGTGDPEAWREASELCERAGLGWERHLAEWRVGEGLLDRGDLAGAAEHLRVAHAFARAEGADPLRDRVVELARISRLDLDVPDPPVLPRQRDRGDSPLATLTGREREVLAHLVAGRTYADIAERLCISEKTVSTHVSHVLTKTGTSSRREAAALALRLSRAGA